MTLVGNQSFIDLGTTLGLPDFSRRVLYGPNFTIAGARVSPLEVASFYATLADQGIAHHPYRIARVTRPDGEVVLGGPDQPIAALDPGAAYLVTTILADPSSRPPADNATLDVGQKVAARRTDDGLESWVAGYTPDLVVVVWTGSSSGAPVTSADPAGRIWSDVMRAALKLHPPVAYPRPGDVVDVSLCKNAACTQKYDEIALRGTEKAVEDANAATIAKSAAPVTGSSQTPLVDRATPAVGPTPSAKSSTSPSITTPTSGDASLDGVLVPDLSGLTLDEARQLLGAFGLSSTPLVQYQSGQVVLPGGGSVAPGQVIATSPPANERVAPGSSVLLIVRKN
jgi:membrane peptidoglycan carboxypeptidase